MAALSLTVWLGAVPAVVAAERPNVPLYFAIENARVVTGVGPALERGTVVVVKGLITAVGTDVAVPPEAWVIDGTGLTVYPGLIDGLGDLGLREARSAEAKASPGRPSPAEGQQAYA
ncbi:MAG: hypothetical protein ACE5JI_05420, partial [Acidobacteriota bacterium]